MELICEGCVKLVGLVSMYCVYTKYNQKTPLIPLYSQLDLFSVISNSLFQSKCENTIIFMHMASRGVNFLIPRRIHEKLA